MLFDRFPAVLLIAFAASIVPLTCVGATLQVGNPEELAVAMKRAKAGDEVVLAEGEWRDVEMRIDGEGTRVAPITIRAAVPGKTVLTGTSRVRLSGSYLVVSGLWLRNPENDKHDWFEFRYDSKHRASHCIVTDCAFTEDDEFRSIDKESRWIGIYGQGNQLTGCKIEGKKNKGATLVVWLGDADQGSHRIESNYFGKRPLLGKNGGETIRIGDSNTSMHAARCVIEGNLFEACNGETECISNKSCENIYRGNTFREVQGTLTLRHGNQCLVEGNVFLGNMKPRTGGIRVIGEDHRVVNNYLQDLEGDDFRAAICILCGYPSSKLHEYFPVKRAMIDKNVLVNCKHSLLIGYHDESKASVPPTDCVFSGNIIVARKKSPAVEVGEQPHSARFDGNLVQADRLGMEGVAGVEVVPKVEVEARTGLTTSDVGPRW